METSPVFDWTCQALEATSQFSALESRGTIRIALKSAGLGPNRVTPRQMEVILNKLLPEELRTRGVADPSGVCKELATRLKEQNLDADLGDTPETVFERLAG